MRASPIQLLPALAAVIAFLVGFLLQGSPADPDAPMRSSQVAGSFLVFTGFAICLVSWGRAISRHLMLDGLAAAIALGTAALSVLAGLLGFLGLVGYGLTPLHLVLLLLGTFLPGPETRRAKGSHDRFEWAIFAIFGVDLMQRLVRASLANGTTDPHMYHLFAPRYWSEVGRIAFTPAWPEMFHASHWEHLFLWGNSLLAAPRGLGLIEGQLFGQWVHLLAYVGAALALRQILIAMGVSRAWAAAGLVASAGSLGMLHYSSVAKNGLGISAWALFSLAMLLPGVAKSPLQLAAAGGLAGMAVSGKATSALSVLPWMAAAWMLRAHLHGFRRSLGQAGWVLAGALAAGLPIYARNYWMTGNPLFPIALHGVFPAPDWWSASSQESLESHFGSLAGGIAEALPRIRSVFLDSPFTPFAFLALALGARKPLGAIAATSLASAAIFSSLRFLNAYPRWIAPSLFVIDALGIAAFGLLLDRLARRHRAIARYSGALALALSCLCLPRLLDPIETFKIMKSDLTADARLRTPEINNGGDSKGWLRRNAKPGEGIASLGDRGYYPYYHLNPRAIFVDPRLDDATSGINDGRELVRRLRSHGIRYAIDVRHFEGGYFRPQGKVMSRLVREHPSAIRYRGKDSYVVDLAVLETALESACVADHPAPDDFLAF